MTSTTTPHPGRFYRLSPPDRTGLMFGLGLAQLVLVAGGVIIGSTLMVMVSVPARDRRVGGGRSPRAVPHARRIGGRTRPAGRAIPAPTQRRAEPMVLDRAAPGRRRTSRAAGARRPGRARRRPGPTRRRTARRRHRRESRPQGGHLRSHASRRRPAVRAHRSVRAGLAGLAVGHRLAGVHRRAEPGRQHPLVGVGCARRARGAPALAARPPRRQPAPRRPPGLRTTAQRSRIAIHPPRGPGDRDDPLRQGQGRQAARRRSGAGPPSNCSSPR